MNMTYLCIDNTVTPKIIQMKTYYNVCGDVCLSYKTICMIFVNASFHENYIPWPWNIDSIF